MLNKLLNMIKRAYVSCGTLDKGQFPNVQITYGAGEQKRTANAEMIFPYGMGANPVINTAVILFNVKADESNLACIPYCENERIKNLSAGDVIFYSPASRGIGFIKFDSAGNIEIITDQNIQIDSNKIGFFGVNPVSQQSGGALNAGSSYTTNEQDMINKMYTALRNLGLLN